MRNDTRKQYTGYLETQAKLNAIASATTQFNVQPSIQQKLETKLQESSVFLSKINIIGVDELKGEKIGLSITRPVASRTDTSGSGTRKTVDPTTLGKEGYECVQVNYDTHIRIGAHDAERRAPQRVRFNVDLYVLLRDSCPRQDSLHEVVDYDLIRSTIAARTARGHIDLQETLCDDVAHTLLQHPKVCAVRVSTEKPDAYPDCEAVGIEIFRIKPNVIPEPASVVSAHPTSD